MLRKLYFNLLYLFTEPPWDTGISPPELLDSIEKHPSTSSGRARRAIDIGCGTATNVITLAKAGWQVTGVDFAPRAIKLAKRKIKKAGIQAEILERSATNLHEISGPFDLALDIGCFHSVQDKKGGYLAELNRILAPGGYWLMYGVFNPDPVSNGPGLAEADLERIQASMTQVWRQDGLEKGKRPSAWFLYQKQK
jgi:ubiquinone/menaquinone biosynthesis C-methylase UbiE